MALAKGSIAVPLTNLNYSVLVVGSMAQITLEQHYSNPMDALL